VQAFRPLCFLIAAGNPSSQPPAPNMLKTVTFLKNYDGGLPLPIHLLLKVRISQLLRNTHNPQPLFFRNNNMPFKPAAQYSGNKRSRHPGTLCYGFLRCRLLRELFFYRIHLDCSAQLKFTRSDRCPPDDRQQGEKYTPVSILRDPAGLIIHLLFHFKADADTGLCPV
jgi:hypothetical protein